MKAEHSRRATNTHTQPTPTLSLCQGFASSHNCVHLQTRSSGKYCMEASLFTSHSAMVNPCLVDVKKKYPATFGLQWKYRLQTGSSCKTTKVLSRTWATCRKLILIISHILAKCFPPRVGLTIWVWLLSSFGKAVFFRCEQTRVQNREDHSVANLVDRHPAHSFQACKIKEP